MPRRLGEPRDPVTLTHDGQEVVAERGEVLLGPLVAAKGYALSRSPKLHRPRGPCCARGACEGCLVRLNGAPNVMACQHRVQGGEVVETQNVLGSRELDLLGATDYLFPRGMDHHRLFAGVRGISPIVQAFARRVSGLGKLPDPGTEPEIRSAQSVDVPVLVVGGGAAGLAAAALLGQRALLADDQPELGGALALLDPERSRALLAEARDGGAALEPATTVAGLYRHAGGAAAGGVTALLVSAGGALAVRCRAVVLATGGHDAAPMFENNDVPGILSARAALLLWSQGVLAGERVVLVGEGRFARRFRTLASEQCRLVPLDADMIVRALGRPELSGVLVRAAGKERRLRADALLFDGPTAPAFELAVQAGASVRFDPARGYVPEVDATGQAAPGVYCAGSVIGAPDSIASGRAAAERVFSALG